MPQFGDCRVTRRNVPVPTTEFDMTVSLEEADHGGGMHVSVEYAAKAISAAYAERFSADWVAILRHALSAPSSSLSALRTAAQEAQ